MKSVIAVLAMCVVATSAVHLTPDNFDELSAGKAVFLKVRQRKREGARGTCTEICSGVDTMRRVDADEALFVAPLRSSPPPWIMFPHWPDSHLTLSHLNSSLLRVVPARCPSVSIQPHQPRLASLGVRPHQPHTVSDRPHPRPPPSSTPRGAGIARV